MPSAFGYRQVPAGTPPAVEAADRKLIGSFATVEGYALEHVFVDADPNRPLAGFAAVIAAARAREGAVILVPNPSHLGSLTRVQMVMQQRLQRESGRPVVFCRRPA